MSAAVRKEILAPCTNDAALDRERMYQGIRSALQQHMPASMPTYASMSRVAQRRVLQAHEHSGVPWKHDLARAVQGAVDCVERATYARIEITNRALSELDALEQVARSLARVAGLASEERRAQCEALVQQRLRGVAMQLETRMRDQIRKGMIEQALATDAPTMRGHEEVVPEKTVRALRGLEDMEDVLQTTDALRDFHDQAVRAELERWSLFLGDCAARG